MNVPSPEFKFNADPTWSGRDRGESNGNGSYSGTLGGNNIKPVDGAGTYFFTVNWPAGTYTMAKRQVAIIGAATPNGWGTPTYLTFDFFKFDAFIMAFLSCKYFSSPCLEIAQENAVAMLSPILVKL